MAPNLDFLLNHFRIITALGLNVFPVFPSWADVSYVLGKDEWQRLLEETFPGGRHEHWNGPAGSDCQLDLYTVSRAEAHSHQGLYLSSGLDVNTSPDLLVSGLNMPGITLRPERSYQWTGAIYLHDAGSWDFHFDGAWRSRLSIGERSSASNSGGCGLTGWFPEGWHAFSARATTTRTAGAPISFRWRDPMTQQFLDVPSEFFLRKLPDTPLFRARPVAEPSLSVASARYRFWIEPVIGGRTQDVAVANNSVYMLGPGLEPILCLDFNGKPVPSWLGLRDQRDRPIALPPTHGFLRFGYSLAAAPGGALFLADCWASRVLFIQPDGQLARLVSFASEEHRLSGIAYDPSSDTVLVADSLTGQILRFSSGGERKADWACFGATALCVSPDGQRIYVVVQRRGGIAVLSPDGREVDFWRAVDVTALSRLTCGPRGNVYVLVEGNRLLGFTPEGRILVRMETLPDPLPRHEARQAFKLAIRALDENELLIGLGGVASGFGVVRLQAPPLSPGAPAVEPVPVAVPGQPDDEAE
jgi:sugar lactone lactonase YvrE